jgi:hypothetical protein
MKYHYPAATDLEVSCSYLKRIVVSHRRQPNPCP